LRTLPIGFVPGYTHDIFVSYAHVDDLPDRKGEDGWVTVLVRRLMNRLAQLLGRQDSYSLWFDSELAHHVPITPEMLGTLEATATLMVVRSPGYLASPWCGRERASGS
jgi:TIR domain